MQHPLFLLFVLSTLSSSTVSIASDSPLSPKASLLRYWAQKIPNNVPKPSFLTSKFSPLSPEKAATLAKLADENALSTHLPSFCEWAHLFCFPQLGASLEKHNGTASFAVYANRNFTNYGTRAAGNGNSFKNYSDNQNIVADSFTRYSRESLAQKESFAHYSPDGNVVSDEFSSYAVSGLGDTGEFINYGHGSNVPDLRFTAYDTDAASRGRTFTSYSVDANAGGQSFSNYAKKGTATPTSFATYANESNVVGSSFSGYGELGVAVNDTFTSYGSNGNVPENTFHSYGEKGNFGSDDFSAYRDDANVGDDLFTSYAKGSHDQKATFRNYGGSANIGSDNFKLYGKGADGQSIGFKIYGENTTFKDYEKKRSISFAGYKKAASSASKNKWVEEGKFFREANLKEGTVMKMPDIGDKMPPRSFLPRSISAKLPFSSARMGELLRVFNSAENSSLGVIVGKTLEECEREPSRGETKRCVASGEDMIDFAVEVLGRDVTVRSTESLGGSRGRVRLGRVAGLNGGRVTKSVSCHQSLFPYLVYYCHSVPRVRVYEAEILDVKSKGKINQGVAICHVDTSAWGPEHGAFVALGGGPGKIEVCHWIFENDLTWVRADH